ncbi:uncharacterized protein EpC_pEp360340 (plasmid) [Erwinia pyrifoliae Ep1/96]|nr:uncharacterized protein EpC_pEp360340 [Erwinia pyrifoliae Ep1/96]
MHATCPLRRDGLSCLSVSCTAWTVGWIRYRESRDGVGELKNAVM